MLVIEKKFQGLPSFQESRGTEKVQSLIYLFNKCLSSPKYVPNPILDVGNIGIKTKFLSFQVSGPLVETKNKYISK